MAEVEEKVVKYVGLADVRVIRKGSWKKIGVESDDVQWDKRNRWTIPVKDLPEAVVEYCRHDRELVVTGE